MAALNPDFKQADEVFVPTKKEFFGYTDGTMTEYEARLKEQREIAELQDDYPVAFHSRPFALPDNPLFKRWNEFQKEKGRFESGGQICQDLTLLDEFVIKDNLAWLPQIIGSCVISNTFRAWVARLMFQNAFIKGEYLGRNEYTPENYSFYCPWSYGMMRRRGGLRRGDGGFCRPMAESLLKDGVLPCDTPALIDLTKSLGVSDPRDYPEPQGSRGKSVYRKFGNWSYLDDLKQYADYRLVETPSVRDEDTLWDNLMKGIPCFVCSMEAIRKAGTHPDGFTIHERNPRSSWAHNMCFFGGFFSSDGERWVRESNESWGVKVIYNRRLSEVGNSFRRNRLTVQGIGEILGPSSSPPVITG